MNATPSSTSGSEPAFDALDAEPQDALFDDTADDGSDVADDHALTLRAHAAARADADDARLAAWIDAIVDRPLRVEGGLAYPRDEAGWGFAIRDDALSPNST